MTTTGGAGAGCAKPALEGAILVVDDTDFNRMIIGAMLEEAGYRDVTFAKDGFEALAAIEERQPDIVLLDIMMPGMDGFEVCRRVREKHGNADLPILVQTALSSMDDRNKAFEAGTTDLVSKPIERHELVARIRIHLENKRLIRHHRAYRARVESELAIARGMYEHLIPSSLERQAVRQSSGVDLHSHLRLDSEIGGTIWGLFPLAEGRFGVFLLEMSGSGVIAALNAFRLHTLLTELRFQGEMPAAVMTALNRRAYDLFADGETAAVLYGVVDPANDLFTYVGAGAPPPRVVGPGGEEVEVGEVEGAPIGVSADSIYRGRRMRFGPRDLLMLENRRLPSMETEDGRMMDPTIVAGQDAVGSAGVDSAFQWLSDGVDAMDVEGGEATDHLAIWLSRALGDDDGDEV